MIWLAFLNNDTCGPGLNSRLQHTDFAEEEIIRSSSGYGWLTQMSTCVFEIGKIEDGEVNTKTKTSTNKF